MFHVKHTPPGLAFLEEEIEAAASAGLYRDRPDAAEEPGLSYCSNDYLALARRPTSFPESGAGASRLVSGERPIHRALESRAAALVGQPAALVFTSGYAANVGLVSCLAGPGDLVVSDALNHASLIDGARLSRARIAVVPHLDTNAVSQALRAHSFRRAVVLTESYFSMDADSPDLRELRRVCDELGAALIVDEAHALGVLGERGRGVCADQGVVADGIMGTFGKAFGAAGAFVAGCPMLVTWLWNRARSFVFSTGLSPAIAATALEGILKAETETWRRERVGAAAVEFRTGLRSMGIRPRGYGHVIPWVVGDPRRALRVAELLRADGIDVRAIRPPSVPEGSSRLRFTVSSRHEPADIERALEAIHRARAEGGPCEGD